MHSKYLCYILLLCFSLNLEAAAQKTAVKHKAYFTLVEAFTQRTLPGIPGVPIKTDTHFILIWKGEKYPETFCWKGDNVWQSCTLVRARKITNRPHNIPAGVDYVTLNVNPKDVHKGDTVELTAITMKGNPAISSEIPADAKNTLFFKTGGSKWLSFPVNIIGKKQDIARP